MRLNNGSMANPLATKRALPRNAREFLSQALLSSHRVILDKLLNDIDVDKVSPEVHNTLSEKAAVLASGYAMDLMMEWQDDMGRAEHIDKEHLADGEQPSTANLTRPVIAPLN
jgi:hypothetical protein